MPRKNIDTTKTYYKKISLKMGEFKIKQENKDSTIVTAYVSIFDNVDYAGEKIIKGAFAESLARKLPKVCWSHNWEDIIGKVNVANEDDKGLLVEMEILHKVQRGAEAVELLKAEAVDEFSIGYSIAKWSWERLDNGDEILVLEKLDLYEVSPVLVGCNPETELVDMKGLNGKNVTDVEVHDNHLELTFDSGEKILLNISSAVKGKLSPQGVKVENNPGLSKAQVLVIKKTLKRVDKQNEYVLKILKDNT